MVCLLVMCPPAPKGDHSLMWQCHPPSKAVLHQQSTEEGSAPLPCLHCACFLGYEAYVPGIYSFKRLLPVLKKMALVSCSTV